MLAGALSARAADAGGTVELRDCGTLDRSVLEHLFSLELRTLGVPSSEFDLRVTCSGTRATLELAAGEGTPVAQANLDLSSTAPGARARLVALAASELVARTERAEVPASPAAAQQRPAAPAARVSSAPPPRARGERRSLLLFAGASAERMGDPKTLLGGALLGTQLSLAERYSLTLESRYARGKTETSIAGVDWTLLTALVGFSLDLEAEPFALSLGPALRAGALALEAKATAPNRGQRLTGPWLGVLGNARGFAALSENWRLFAGVEGGCVILPVRGTVDEGRVLVAASGCSFGGSLGLAYSF